jgi:hypothetical protein
MNFNLNNINKLIGLDNKTIIDFNDYKNKNINNSNIKKIQEYNDIFLIITNKNIKNIKSLIYSKKDLKLITYFDNFNYSDKNKDFIINNWDDIEIYQNFEGPRIQIFNYNNNWYTTTWNNLTAETYNNNNNYTIRELLYDTNKINFNELDKKTIYKFILLHYKQNDLIKYKKYGTFYKELVLLNLDEKNKDLLEKFIIPSKYYFSCIDELLMTINKISHTNMLNRQISLNGFLIKINNNLINIYTDIYIKINNIKKLNINNYQLYLDLYQKNELNDYLPYFTNYYNEITYRINMSMKTLSKDILNIYHITRKKKEKELYESLTPQFKKILYDIHGLYIKNRKKDFVNNYDIYDKECKAISVHDIYYYLKNIQTTQLIQLYKDRNELLKNNNVSVYINKDCIYTITQTKLMFL